MPKRASLDPESGKDLFRPTAPDPTQPGGGLAFEDLDDGNIQSTGVGLREGEIKALKQVGAALGEYLGANKVARNSIMRLAIRRFLEGLQDGSITLAELSELFTTPEKPQPKLKL